MRIVAGRHKGRRLAAPGGRSLRPTSDRMREALFDILSHGRFSGGASPIVGARVLDAFAGTGALGFEALSRGAGEAVFMDVNPVACAAVRANARALDEEGRVTVIEADATRPPPGTASDLVILDAPYGEDLTAPALTALAEAGWIAKGALVAAELPLRRRFDPPPSFAVVGERRYGKTRLIFMRYRP